MFTHQGLIPLNDKSDSKLCFIDLRLPYQYSYILSIFWNQSHFLSDSECFVYRMDNLSQEDVFLKRKLESLFEDLAYSWDIVYC